MRTLAEVGAVVLSIIGLFFLLFVVIKVLHKLWWTPTRIQRLMSVQGIKGPSYRFIHGNTKQISALRKESMTRPLVGLSHNILPKVSPHVDSWIGVYGKNYLQWSGAQPQLVITEPELIKEVLNNRNGAYPKTEANSFVRKLMGDGLLTAAEGEKWAKLRKLANYAFHGESLKGMNPAMISSVEVMLERWRNYEGKEVEVFEEFRLLTSEVISRTAFGSSYLEGKKIFDMLQKLSFLICRNAFKVRFPGFSKFFKTKDEIESDILAKEIRKCVMEIIKKREEKVLNGEEDSFGSDFLGVLIKAHHDADEKQRISMDDMVDECKTFYVAGQETVNSLLAWTVLLLAVHTDWQEEARKEVLNLFGQENPNPDGIWKLKTLSNVINESLRLYPPIASNLRKVEREVRLGKLILPANLILSMSYLSLHHDPQIWGEDAHQFKPERFSEGIAKATTNSEAAFFPFGAGPRSCVGMNFAINEAKIALSMILQRYSFTLSPVYVHSPIQLLTLCPQRGIQVTLQSL